MWNEPVSLSTLVWCVLAVVIGFWLGERMEGKR
jgi:hypothetical protein